MRERALATPPRRAGGAGHGTTALAWALAAPALAVIAAVALFPVVWTLWESLHLDDLRMPWRGRPFVGISNYVEVFGAARFWSAFGHTLFFVASSLIVEMVAGLAVALALHRATSGRGLVRTAVLLPWAVPTVVVALIWRFLFESPGGAVSTLAGAAGVTAPTWLAHPQAAWVPLILADAWKTTPFVAILLLAGLQTIDGSLYEAAAVDGASRWRQFTAVTLPMLRPTLLVAGLFRALDAFRVFDLVYVLTGGGPGTATEPLALYTYSTLLQNLQFGLGAALSIITFAGSCLVALVAISAMGDDTLIDRMR